ncbi:hypothetical protein B0B51_07620 [blood disease bacterium A2-HR MARDI]|uniref:Uncharacterized protein n=1 Tax=blood disease bacterium A2-HR MARDI TaxID=1944648 RepID=A0A1U9VLB6_9RALS|nr:hypothetical protein B0B51_07620 [blood disease bacterium A2-HR MARDI]
MQQAPHRGRQSMAICLGRLGAEPLLCTSTSETHAAGRFPCRLTRPPLRAYINDRKVSYPRVSGEACPPTPLPQ